MPLLLARNEPHLWSFLSAQYCFALIRVNHFQQGVPAPNLSSCFFLHRPNQDVKRSRLPENTKWLFVNIFSIYWQENTFKMYQDSSWHLSSAVRSQLALCRPRRRETPGANASSPGSGRGLRTVMKPVKVNIFNYDSIFWPKVHAK